MFRQLYTCNTLKSNGNSYPFGMQMPGRQSPLIAGDEHRYGFNGMEMDDEVKNQHGTSYDFGARMLDSRVGRWLTIDPLAQKYASLNPNNFVGNMPIIAVDPDGKDIIIAYQWTYKGKPKMRQLKYSEGKLYDLDGKVWNDGGIGRTFFDAVRTDLNKLKSDHADVKMVVEDLEHDKYSHFVSNRENMFGTTEDKLRYERYDDEGLVSRNRPLQESDNERGKGKGGSWTPYDAFRWTEEYSLDGNTETGTKDRYRPPRVTLGHEFFHAWERMKNILTRESETYENESGEKIPTREVRAVNFENLIRRSAKKPDRIKYSNKDIPKDKLK
jgi:RHS repeat-associated protein